ncbi:hypothetical protein BaRGS_00002765 [Batillaria attramentaria]|uniref:Uncharacterized protein n=1 Tax=Batillaria attramentaria TaxID=370345 RepID=A0ABD0M457_9CAEN
MVRTSFSQDLEGVEATLPKPSVRITVTTAVTEPSLRVVRDLFRRHARGEGRELFHSYHPACRVSDRVQKRVGVGGHRTYLYGVAEKMRKNGPINFAVVQNEHSG